jgi:hypothetical protein
MNRGLHYTGMCRGGPRDGERFDHYRPEIEVPYLLPFKAKLFSGEEPPSSPEVKYGTYRHVLGQWIWRDADHQDVRLR